MADHEQPKIDDVTGLMVSRGSLLVSSRMRIPVSRAEALIQHEVGTHVLTYYNGKAQPFRQLYSGLAGYESLQEGLAVLAEHLVGALLAADAARLHLVYAANLAGAALGSLGVGMGRELLNFYRGMVQKQGDNWPRFNMLMNSIHALMDQEYSWDINIIPSFRWYNPAKMWW